MPGGGPVGWSWLESGLGRGSRPVGWPVGLGPAGVGARPRRPGRLRERRGSGSGSSSVDRLSMGGAAGALRLPCMLLPSAAALRLSRACPAAASMGACRLGWPHAERVLSQAIPSGGGERAAPPLGPARRGLAEPVEMRAPATIWLRRGSFALTSRMGRATAHVPAPAGRGWLRDPARTAPVYVCTSAGGGPSRALARRLQSSGARAMPDAGGSGLAGGGRAARGRSGLGSYVGAGCRRAGARCRSAAHDGHREGV